MERLRVEELTARRGEIAVLAGLSFSVAAGEAVILRGPNGIGKTTLLRILAGLAPPAAGRVVLDEESAAFSGHADGIKATLSVAENLRFWAGVFGGMSGTGAIAPALEAFDLVALADRRAQDLSAGQKRRLGLARMLVTGRPLWLMDEPTVSLDAASVMRFAGVVRAHCASGGAAVIATHVDLGLPEALIVDLGPYRARPEAETNPFLDAGW